MFRFTFVCLFVCLFLCLFVCLFVCFLQDEASSTVLNALKAVDRGSRKTRNGRIAVVKA